MFVLSFGESVLLFVALLVLHAVLIFGVQTGKLQLFGRALVCSAGFARVNKWLIMNVSVRYVKNERN